MSVRETTLGDFENCDFEQSFDVDYNGGFVNTAVSVECSTLEICDWIASNYFTEPDTRDEVIRRAVREDIGLDNNDEKTVTLVVD